MLWSRQYINKFFSGSLLIVLLIVHSIKLLHSHNYNQLHSDREAKVESKVADCEICNYQISKDTDNSSSFIEHIDKIEQIISYDEYILTTSKIFHSKAESRGPPAA